MQRDEFLRSIGIDPTQLLATCEQALDGVYDLSVVALSAREGPNAVGLVEQQEEQKAVQQQQPRMFSLPPRSSCVLVPYAIAPSSASVVENDTKGSSPDFLLQLCVDGQQQRESHAPPHYDFPSRMMLQTHFPSFTADSVATDKTVERQCRDLFLAPQKSPKDGCHYRPLDVMGELERDLAVKREALKALHRFRTSMAMTSHHYEGGETSNSSTTADRFIARPLQPFR